MSFEVLQHHRGYRWQGFYSGGLKVSGFLKIYAILLLGVLLGLSVSLGMNSSMFANCSSFGYVRARGSMFGFGLKRDVRGSSKFGSNVRRTSKNI